MKTPFNTLILLLLMPAFLLAGNKEKGKYSKEKSIQKTYTVNPDAGIDITNSYGSIFVTTWDEDKIELEVLIKVSGDNEEWVNKRISDIDVDINALKSLVTTKTVIGNSVKNSGRNNSFEINYTLKIPKKGSVKLNNKYGDIITTDLFSKVNVSCKYGKITMAKLSSAANTISIEYCNQSVIESIKGGSVTAKYSKLTLNDFGKIALNADYTDVSIVEGEDLNYNSSYGKLNFGKIKNLDGTGDYLTIKAEEISGDVKLQTRYGKINILNVTSQAGNILIGAAYTNVAIGYNANYSFSFDINVKYGNFNYDKELQSEVKTESRRDFSKNYKGSNKKGENKILINSEYGNVNLFKS